MYYEKYLNYLHTSSGWAAEDDIAKLAGCLQGEWSKPHDEGGVIISNHDGKLIVDGGDECRHVLIIGATGTGKSRLIIMPSLLYSLTSKKKRSFVVFDVKGELEASTASIAEQQGYRLRRIDFRNPESGDGWNPFVKINRLYKQGGKARSKARKLLEDFIVAIFNDGPNARIDPFWRNISGSLFRGICSVIWENGEDLTLPWIMKMINSIPGDKDEDHKSLLFRAANRLPEDSIAHRNLEGFKNGSNITRGNVIACFNTYMSTFTSRDDIMEMMSSQTSLDFRDISKIPTVLYISLPDDTTALGGLQGMLITQLMQDLNECAMSNGGILPIRTEIYLDEICNIHPAIPSLESSLTISRSRGIRYVLAIQSYSQLCGVYESAAETIAANCSTWVALNIAKDETFRTKLSQLCGDNPLGDPLITPSQLALLQYEEGIVIRERSVPFFAQFEDLSKTKERMKIPDDALQKKSKGLFHER